MLKHNARELQAFDVQVAQTERLQNDYDNQKEPELNLVLGGGFRSEAGDLSGSAKFDQPQYMISVNFRYLGQRTAMADLNRARLQKR